jgi:uncharacterized membrane protein (UPF0127 family)
LKTVAEEAPLESGTRPERVVDLILGRARFRATVADTEAARKRGLSGHPGLAADEAMLFVWEAAGPRRLHMRQMLFPIDMIFVSEAEEILNVVEEAPPSLDHPGTRYHSRDDARWIVECIAGTVRSQGLAAGMRIDIRSALAAPAPPEES